jgi:hypothetical protein
MKLWELSSYFRSEPGKLNDVVNDPRWVELAPHFRNLTRLVGRQDRAALDMQLPDAMCRQALTLTDRIYTDHGGNLIEITRRPRDPSQKVLTALQVFDCYGGHYLEEVQEHGCCRVPRPPSSEQAIVIIDTIKNGDLMTAKKLSEEIDFRKNRALALDAFGWAIEMEHYPIADWLLTRGVDIDAYNVQSETTLDRAIEQGNPKTVAYLLERGASANALTLNGDTMLHLSIDMEVEEAISKTDEEKQYVPASDEMTRLLVKHGAKVWVKNKKEEMPIDWAIQRGHRAAEQFLREQQRLIGLDELITIIPTNKKQAFAALCLAQFCAIKKINHAPIWKLIEHLLSVLIKTNLPKWGEGDIAKLRPLIRESIAGVLPADVSAGEFRELVNAVIEVGQTNMYTGPLDEPLEQLQLVIKILGEFAVPIPAVDADFFLRGHESLGEGDGWGRNVDAQTYQKIWNVYENIRSHQ